MWPTRAVTACSAIPAPAKNRAKPLLLEQAVTAGVGRFVLDSYEEIDRLAYLARRRGTRPRVMVRVTAGVEAHTHEFIATAHEDQKFGFSLASGDAAEAVRRVLALPRSSSPGCTRTSARRSSTPRGFEVAAHRVLGLPARIHDEHGVPCPSSTSAAASASPTPARTTRLSVKSWRPG